MSILKKLGILLLSLTLSAGVFVGNASATPVWEGSFLMGFDDINVDGTMYDVRLLDGTIFQRYGDTPTFTFTTATGALLASQALIDQAFVGEFAHDINEAAGIASPSDYYVFTPYSFIDPDVFFAIARGGSVFETSLASRDTGTDVANTGASPYSTWAKWSLSDPVPAEDPAAPVPEPSTIFLLGAGLAGLVAYSRKRQRQL